ncbi:MAG: A/G-specific adenine glycosylase [Spirochaetota bacterium]
MEEIIRKNILELYGRDGLCDDVIKLFRDGIYSYYRESGRVLPWRETDDPYKIAVSEIMLQQTQVDRVVGKYLEFVERFPSWEGLAGASLEDVLSAWQGLGYNRRGRFLREMARVVVDQHGGVLPHDEELLLKLPGIGRATAASIRAFAFNLPSIYIETNVRTVFFYFFFMEGVDGALTPVSDEALTPLVEATLDRENPRMWYNALMDYGTMLKKKYGNLSVRSAHYRSQSPFKGSNREVRGKILRVLLADGALTHGQLVSMTGESRERIRYGLDQLVGEGMVAGSGGKYRVG